MSMTTRELFVIPKNKNKVFVYHVLQKILCISGTDVEKLTYEL